MIVYYSLFYLLLSSGLPAPSMSFSMLFMPSLNERTPLPMPLISSGIFATEKEKHYQAYNYKFAGTEVAEKQKRICHNYNCILFELQIDLFQVGS